MTVNDIRASGSPLSATDDVTFYLGLKRRDGAAKKALLATSRPGKTGYRVHLSPAATAKKFGATKATENEVGAYFKSLGIRAAIDKSRVFMRLTASPSTFITAFGTGLTALEYEQFLFVAPNTDPVLPARIKALAPQPIWQAQHQIPWTPEYFYGGPTLLPTAPHNTGTAKQTCTQMRQIPTFAQTVVPDQLATAYSIKKLQPSASNRGDVPASAPELGILSLGAGFSDQSLATAADCYGFRTSVTRLATDGMTGPLIDNDSEGDLDVQTGASMLRNGKLRVYESASGQIGWFLAPAAALNDNVRPSVLSMSYAACESEFTVQDRALTDAVLVRLGLVGTSVFASTGDTGSSGCLRTQQSKAKGINYPASSPWITAAGGTRLVLNKDNSRRRDVVWNDQHYFSPPLPAAGTGGTSTLYSRPSFQDGHKTGSSQRTVPDISANASIMMGFGVVQTGFPNFAQNVGGTSLASPMMAAGTALINHRLKLAGKPSLGYLNPWLYQLPKSAIFDVVKGNNDLFNVGCCTAKKGYDQASGLGTPNFWPMASAIAAAR